MKEHKTIVYDNSALIKKAREEKEYRTKLYLKNKEQYKKEKEKFIYGISQNFKQKRKNQRQEMK